MVEVGPHLVDGQRVLALAEPDVDAELVERRPEVLPVLAAARVRGVRAGDQRDDPAGAVGVRGRQGVRRVRLPVAVAPHHRQVDAAPGELVGERLLQRQVLAVDRARAAEVVVVLGDHREPLVGDVLPGGDVAQERQHVVGTVRAPEREEQQRVVRGDGARGRSRTARCSRQCRGPPHDHRTGQPAPLAASGPAGA